MRGDTHVVPQAREMQAMRKRAHLVIAGNYCGNRAAVAGKKGHSPAFQNRSAQVPEQEKFIGDIWVSRRFRFVFITFT